MLTYVVTQAYHVQVVRLYIMAVQIRDCYGEGDRSSLQINASHKIGQLSEEI